MICATYTTSWLRRQTPPSCEAAYYSEANISRYGSMYILLPGLFTTSAPKLNTNIYWKRLKESVGIAWMLIVRVGWDAVHPQLPRR